MGSDIPEWLLIEVLIKLPVKKVFRVKLVCKQWLSVISDPSFIRMYISQASLMPHFQAWTFIFKSPVDPSSALNKLGLLEYVYSQDLKFPSLYVLPWSYHDQKYKIVDASNGLVLYAPFVCIVDCYNIYNPITGQRIALPLHARPFDSVKSSFVTHVENGSLTSYRVVRLEILSDRSNVIRFEVFVSEIGEWKDFTVYTEQAIKVSWHGMATVLNGILHWITLENWIIAYDPYLNPDSLRFIALPSDEDLKDNDEKLISSLCNVHQGRLRYFKAFDVSMPPHGFSSFGVWILNDYSSGHWCLQHKINSADILYDDVLFGKCLFLVPMSFHPFDPETVYFGYGDFVVSYNIKTRKLEAQHAPTNVSRLRLWCRAILFVIPPWPTSITPPLSFRVS